MPLSYSVLQCYYGKCNSALLRQLPNAGDSLMSINALVFEDYKTTRVLKFWGLHVSMGDKGPHAENR